MSFVRQEPPRWFWRVSQGLTLWAAVLCFLGARHYLFDPDASGSAGSHFQYLFYHLPEWYNYTYVIAAGLGLLGGLALLNRAVTARWLFALALAAFVIRFGWLFATTSALKVGGPAAMVLPLLIVAVAFASVKFAQKARRHGWIC
jgi:hypothetical protein